MILILEKGFHEDWRGVRGRGVRDSYWVVLRQTLDMLICRGVGGLRQRLGIIISRFGDDRVGV